MLGVEITALLCSMIVGERELRLPMVFAVRAKMLPSNLSGLGQAAAT